MSWPLLTDPNGTNPLPVDAIGDDSNATTWLRVINALAAPINYRGAWADLDGYFHLDPYLTPAARAAEFTFDVDDPTKVIVARNRSRSLDINSVPNRWIFLQSNLGDGSGVPVLPTEGAGQYTVQNTLDGLTSITARGGEPIGVRTAVIPVDAADQTTLVQLGDQRAAADRSQAAAFSWATSPFPAAWHEDVVPVFGPGDGRWRDEAAVVGVDVGLRSVAAAGGGHDAFVGAGRVNAAAQVVFVATTSPLTVRETADATPVPGRVVTGSSYSPTVGDPVLVVFARSVYYILGGVG